MNIREISDALKINRNSVAKYLDILTTREEVECKVFGKSKVYFLSQNIPVTSLIRFSTHLMAILNRDFRLVQINDAFLRLLDQPRERVIGTLIQDIRSPLLKNDLIISWSVESMQGKEVTGEIPVTLNGTSQNFRVVLTPTRFPDNTPGIILVFENITEKTKIQAALAESEEKFRAFLEESGDGCLIINESGVIVAWNTALEKISGIPRNTAVGSSLVDRICDVLIPEHRSEEYRSRLKAMLTGTHGGRHPFFDIPDEFQIVRADGQRKYLQKLTFPIRSRESIHVGMIIRDHTERKSVEESLVREKGFQNAIMDSVMGIICVVDENEHFVRWNKNVEEITGYTPGELIRLKVSDTVIAEDREAFVLTFDTALNGSYRSHIEARIQTRQGTAAPFLITGVTTHIGERKYRVYLGLNISKRKQAEDALAREKALLEGLLNSIPDLVFFKDLDGAYLGCNAEFARHTGRERKDVIGSTDFDLYPEEDAKKFRNNDALMMQSGNALHNEEWIEYPDKRRVLVDTLKSPLVDMDGRRIGILGVARDITERKMAEELLRKSEARYRRIVETANESICIMDQTLTITFVNQRFAELLGYRTDEMIGRPIDARMHPGDLDDHNQRMRNRASGFKESYERRLLRKDGSICWVLVSVTPLYDPEGRYEGSFAMMTDISERHEAERLLRESEERFRHLIDLVPGLAVQGYYLDGTTFYWNAASERLYGYTREEAVGKNLLDLIIPPEMRMNVASAIAGMASSGEPIPSADLSLMKKDGRRVDVYSGHAIVSVPGQPAQLFCMDIDLTERKRVEQAVRESEYRFQQVAENAGEWIWEIDPEGRYIYSSSAVTRILGYTPEELVGKMHFYDLFPPSCREDLKQQTLASVNRHEPFQRYVNPAVHKNGNRVILETSGSPAYSLDGTFTGFRGCDTDLTEWHKLENARQAALEQIEKNIGQLMMLGDRIRNPLTAILVYAGMTSPEAEKKIALQVSEIERLISDIDKGWLESEHVRSHLRKYYDIDLPAGPGVASGGSGPEKPGRMH